jgi:hypothetical protein
MMFPLDPKMAMELFKSTGIGVFSGGGAVVVGGSGGFKKGVDPGI